MQLSRTTSPPSIPSPLAPLSLSNAIDKRSIKFSFSKKLPQKLRSDFQFPALVFDESSSGSGNSVKHLTKAISSILCESELTNLETGLQLLQFIKKDLGLSPPRTCLDFLLGACANAKDADSSRLIWKEYEKAGHPYNYISYLRMYQALLASGDKRSAKVLVGKIPKDDAHVCYIIKHFRLVYDASSSVKKKKGKNKKKMLKKSRNETKV